MKKATIEFDETAIIVDGVIITLNVIPQILYELAHPDPRKWYRFERVDDRCIVHVEMRDPAGPVMECPQCGFNTTAHYSFCPYHREALVPSKQMEVRNGEYVRQRSRSSEDAGSEGQEAPHSHDEHSPYRQ